MKRILLASAIVALTAAPALAGPPPWAGGPGGPGNNNDLGGNSAFEGWAGGEAMSGSANAFEFNGKFNEIGGSLGGISAEAWQHGQASVNAGFVDGAFNSTLTSEHFGGMEGIGGGIGGGVDHRFDFSGNTMGQSFTELEWGMNSSEFNSW